MIILHLTLNYKAKLPFLSLYRRVYVTIVQGVLRLPWHSYSKYDILHIFYEGIQIHFKNYENYHNVS